jgi:hypothetical protein
MRLFVLEEDRLAPVAATTFEAARIRERQDLQRFLKGNIEVIDPDLLVIAEEYGDWEDSRRRIDLLAVDRDANLVVIELKRDEDGGHMELQALRYAAMVAPMTFQQAVATYQRHLDREQPNRDAESLLLEFFGRDSAADCAFGEDVRIVLVAHDFSRELTTTVMWLLHRELDVRCFRLQPHQLDGRLLVAAQQIIPLPEASEYQVSIREKEAVERRARRQRVHGEWQGHYYVNIDDGNGRSWDDCRRFGFIGASGGRRYTDALQRLSPGDVFFAYQKNRGYVGMGRVVEAAVPITDFEVDGRPLLSCELSDTRIGRNAEDVDLCEWLCRVDWIRTVPLDRAVWQPTLFANQNVVCRLRDTETLEFLQQQFGRLDEGVISAAKA